MANRLRPGVAAAGFAFLLCYSMERLMPSTSSYLTTAAGWNCPRSAIVLGPMSCSVDRVWPADSDDIATLLRLTNAESGVDPDAISARYVSDWIAAAHMLFGARAAPGLVGYAILERCEAIGVVGLSVLRHYRRKGLGERLMRALLTAVRNDERIDQIWLAVARENLPARRLYEKLAFVDRADPPPSLVVPAGYSAMLWRPDH
jgi:GNAT superfamily N-acetyltransferase